MSYQVRTIGPTEAETFVRQTLFAGDRTRPVVAVSSNPRDPAAALDPARLAVDIGDVADVYALETGEATWALSAALPSRLDVYGGAVRIWWPGLSATSSPRDHPLLFCFAPDEAVATARRLIGLVRARAAPRAAPRPPPRPVRPPPPRAPAAGPVRSATVTKVEPRRVEIDVDGAAGVLVDADMPIEKCASELSVGEPLQVRETFAGGSSLRSFTARGVLQDPWPRIGRAYAVGDVVRGRVCRIEDTYVLVEVLPGAALLVPRSEIDWSRFHRITEVLQVGEVRNVKILAIDADARRGTGSIQQGYATAPRPAIQPAIGQPPFLADDAVPAPAAESGGDDERTALVEELRSVVSDREDLIRRLKEAGDQIASLRKALRSAEDRAEAQQGERVDPHASETAFLTAVRLEYALRFDEGSRVAHPLLRMRVGREFLARLRELEGIDVTKVVEVCAQVASGRAHEIPGRSVHELRAGEKGADGRVRSADGAKAWRCSLQEGTPSARRLHWWEIPGAAGKTVEFASVSVHDDLTIPS